MSSDSTNLAETIRLLKDSQPGMGVDLSLLNGLSARAGKPADPKTVAFQAQLNMAQQVLNASNRLDDSDEDTSSQRMDTGLMSDNMMMDALATIARLTGQDLPAQKPALVQNAIAELEKSLTRNPSAEGLGSIAARFESGDKGAAAIGYDRTGGTSYGKFQISSRAGTMKRFLNFLSESEPALAQRLRASGPANTGSTQGRMPAEWQKIAAESPERFERLQTEFIKKDHYQPARDKIMEQTGVDIEATKPALREALFSTAVQHGATGAARIFGEAIDKFLGKTGTTAAAGQVAGQITGQAGRGFEQALVSEVYNRRQNQFGGSTEAVRASVRGRLKQEKDMVLAMLDKKGMNRIV